jgi:hypothetical protein
MDFQEAKLALLIVAVENEHTMTIEEYRRKKYERWGHWSCTKCGAKLAVREEKGAEATYATVALDKLCPGRM